jgi:hypothetical protein
MFHTKPTIEDLSKTIGLSEGLYSAANKGDTGYDNCREYYENSQKPSGADDNTFITKNLITDYVNRQVSKLVAGDIEPTYIGAAEDLDALENLVFKMLEYNKFKEFLIEYFGNLFEVEGLAGWKYTYDPFEVSVFGLGTPTIRVLRPGVEILLDPNNPNPFNADNDVIRIMKQRMLKAEAKIRWPNVEFSENSEEDSGNESALWVDIFEIEYKLNIFYPATLTDDPNVGQFKEAELPSFQKKKYTGNGKYTLYDPEAVEPEDAEDLLKIKIPTYFRCVLAGRTQWAEEPQMLPYDGFTIIPAFHTPRIHTAKWPQSNLPLIMDIQDQINILYSVLTEVAEAAPKPIPYLTGVTDDEITRAKKQITKPDGMVWFNSPTARVSFPPSPQLPAQLVQFLEMNMAILDRIGADYSPSRGEVSGDISGKAILALQSRDDLTQFVQKKHIEASLVELFRRLLESAIVDMTEPFHINRMIDGEDKKIYYNYPTEEIEDYGKEWEEENIARAEEGMVNNLALMDMPDVKVDVQLNVFQKKAEELQKAQIAANMQMIAPIDFHKSFYPNKWPEIHENWLQFSSANQIVQTIIDTFGEDIAEALPDIMRMAKEFALAQDMQEGEPETSGPPEGING